MSRTPMHRVFIFALDDRNRLVRDATGKPVLDHVIETPYMMEARLLFIEVAAKARTIQAAQLVPCAGLFTTLADYLNALNTPARTLARHPEKGVSLGFLKEDPAYWARIGITTPCELADHLETRTGAASAA